MTSSKLPVWALVVALLAVSALAWFGAVRRPTGEPAASARDQPSVAEAADVAGSTDGLLATDTATPVAPAADATAVAPVGEVTPAVAEPEAAVDAPLRILADPPELRVWANTRVILRAQWPEGRQFERLVWHFEDGGDPVAGAEVVHVFAESVRDRHITLEGQRAGEPPTVVSRRLPVERLPVAPVDGDSASEGQAQLKAPAGERLLWVGGAAAADAVLAVAERVKAASVVATEADTARALAAMAPRDLSVLLWSLVPDDGPPLAILRDPAARWQRLHRGEHEASVWSSGAVAWIVADTRSATIAEAELKRVHDGLQLAAPYRTAVLLSARSLTQLRDGEMIADRAYRIYEHALRHQASLALSAMSGVFYEGRFGGLRVASIGAAAGGGCARLLGSDPCQTPALTVLDVDVRGKPEVHFLTGATWQHVVARSELPREVGKVRR